MSALTLTGSTAATLCAGLNPTPDTPSTIDLGEFAFARPSGLVHLGLFLRFHTARGCRFMMKPAQQKAHEYMKTQNFYSRFEADVQKRPELLLRARNLTSLNRDGKGTDRATEWTIS